MVLVFLYVLLVLCVVLRTKFFLCVLLVLFVVLCARSDSWLKILSTSLELDGWFDGFETHLFHT